MTTKWAGSFSARERLGGAPSTMCGRSDVKVSTDMKKLLATLILTAGIWSLAGPSSAAECGGVSIAEMDWASAGVAAHVDKFILETGYGCSVKLVAGDTMLTFTSMNEKRSPTWCRSCGSTPYARLSMPQSRKAASSKAPGS